ncbi:MAG: homoserine dehydrogenase, partial [Myxococcales bacterium]|nr:homoserine dehydrogenase [Myxococcales bacterium]
MRSVTVGILGLGNVGAGTVRLLQERRAATLARLGAVIDVRRICVRDRGRRRAVDVPAELITDDPYELIDDPLLDVVVELVGGV